MLRRARRKRNRFGGFCVSCEEWVDAGEGWLPLPYDSLMSTPLHCEPCFEVFDAIDRALSSSSDIPDQTNERKP